MCTCALRDTDVAKIQQPAIFETKPTVSQFSQTHNSCVFRSRTNIYYYLSDRRRRDGRPIHPQVSPSAGSCRRRGSKTDTENCVKKKKKNNSPVSDDCCRDDFGVETLVRPCRSVFGYFRKSADGTNKDVSVTSDDDALLVSFAPENLVLSQLDRLPPGRRELGARNRFHATTGSQKRS